MQKEKTMKLTKAIITMILLITITQNIYASSFEEKFEWVKQTFEENDAGVPHIIERKGQQAYDVHNLMILERIRAVESMDEFLQISRDWLTFFRRFHHQIMLNPHLVTTDAEKESEQEVEEEVAVLYPNPGFWDGDIIEFKEYITTLGDEPTYEGIWDSGGNYTIGIVREGNSYIGFIIDSAFEQWLPNMIKLRIDVEGDDVVSTFYMRDFAPEVSGAPIMIGNNIMRMVNRWTIEIRRLQPVFQESIFIENYLRFLSSTEPFIERLNENTMYFRIPIFNIDTTYLKNIIEENISEIASTENLIIDLRNNPGGQNWYPILDYLYTNPIKSFDELDFYATERNIQIVYDLSRGVSLFSGLTDNIIELATKVYEQVYNRVGEFVRLSMEKTYGSFEYTTGQGAIILDEIHQYPRNVGIIVNRRTGSSSEHYILTARQSRKVKIFGETTVGAVDTCFVVGGGLVESPCGEIWLMYTDGRSAHVPDLVFDDIGIQPDFFIDSSVPSYKWVEHVNEVMSGWVGGNE